MLGGAGAAAAMAVVPKDALRALLPTTDVNTLTSLAAKGEFGSSDLQMPNDVFSSNWEFFLDGEPILPLYVNEFYAPVDADGWLVVYNKDDLGESLLTGRITYNKTQSK